MTKQEQLWSEIERHVIDGAGSSFQGDDFRTMCKPCVYLFLKGDSVLYVGMSGNGIQRAAQTSHHASQARDECDTVRLYPCKSIASARELEALLIGITSPSHNKRQKVHAYHGAKGEHKGK